jgi:hypothetical protein
MRWCSTTCFTEVPARRAAVVRTAHSRALDQHAATNRYSDMRHASVVLDDM